jgi:hypothetical protein
VNRGLYAYAITRDHSSDLAGPHLITHRDLALVVADVDLDRFAEITAAMAESPSEDSPLVKFVRRHDSVVRAVFDREPVLPLRFGTVLGSAEDAVTLLSARHDEVAAWLERVEGRREWGVRVRAATVPQQAVQRPEGMSGTEYLAWRRWRLTAVEQARDDALSLHRSLAARSADSTQRERPGDHLLDAAYLVDVSDEGGFHDEAERRGAELDLRVEVTGPWPPYSFTKVEFGVAADG